ncbi:hypothetical protein B0J12DRAFT_681886, partial [Macrophomina phaseolina]
FLFLSFLFFFFFLKGGGCVCVLVGQRGAWAIRAGQTTAGDYKCASRSTQNCDKRGGRRRKAMERYERGGC